MIEASTSPNPFSVTDGKHFMRFSSCSRKTVVPSFEKLSLDTGVSIEVFFAENQEAVV